MVAAALAFGYHPHTIREMMQLTAHAVFSEQQGGRYSLSAAKWSNRFLALFCQEVWKDATMADTKIETLVPAFLLNNGNEDMEIRIFATSDPATQQDFVRDVLMRSCAAPVYFPSWQNHVDGGVFAHNPADLALSYAVSTLCIPIHKIRILSLSTGSVRQALSVPEDLHDYGYYQWASRLPAVIWRGMIDKSSYLCQQFLGIPLYP
jgi:patatin-like phospholipase/acyl hydrolase